MSSSDICTYVPLCVRPAILLSDPILPGLVGGQPSQHLLGSVRSWSGHRSVEQEIVTSLRTRNSIAAPRRSVFEI